MNRAVIIALIAASACAEEFRYDTRRLIGLWRGEGNSTASLVDHGPLRRNATCTNVTTFSGGATRFDAQLTQRAFTDDYIKVADATTIANGITVAAWMRADQIYQSSAATSEYAAVSQYNGVGGAADGLILAAMFRQTVNTNGFRFGFGGNAGENLSFNSPQPGLYDKLWHHICITYNTNGTIAFYYDGITAAVSNRILTFGATSTTNITIGGRNPLDNLWGPLSGWIDDVAIYNRPLSFAEVRNIYENTRR